MGHVEIRRLHEALYGGDDVVGGLALEGLGFEGLHDVGEDLCGLVHDGWVLSMMVLVFG